MFVCVLVSGLQRRALGKLLFPKLADEYQRLYGRIVSTVHISPCSYTDVVIFGQCHCDGSARYTHLYLGSGTVEPGGMGGL